MSQNKTQPNPQKVRVKFNVDDSSKDAVDKFKTDNFIESVKKDSDKISKNSRPGK
ncbi:MAG: hypothetical protein ACI9W6_002175 [Motiliproteus sp.]|jgi:hypothetical protein